MKRILIEASGSLVANWLIKAIHDSGHIVVASDIVQECAGRYLADDFVKVPPKDDPKLWAFMEKMLYEKAVDLVIPSLDETLLLWAEKRDYLKEYYGIDVIISDPEVIIACSDKYLTYQFFAANNIPTPMTSLKKDYPLIKPRFGRGGAGVHITDDSDDINMEGMISQEYLRGQEYTVDCLANLQGDPIYIVPRKRLKVKDGKCVDGEVVEDKEIINIVNHILKSARFFGPINIQCFRTTKGVKFIEINPRVGGGMALGLAATENWVKLLIDNILLGKRVEPRPVKYGMRMLRYYEEVYI
jgi:carbamoyl-phosphate synthase large subunit